MSQLADFLHTLIDAIDRPADHPAAELHEEVDAALAAQEAPTPEEAEAAPEPPPEPSAEIDDATQPEPPPPYPPAAVDG